MTPKPPVRKETHPAFQFDGVERLLGLMTIAIAAICECKSKEQTGNIILCTDTMLSWDVESSNDAGYKIYDLPHGFFVAGSDSVSKTHQFSTYLYSKLNDIKPDDPSFVERVRLAIEAANQECRYWVLTEAAAEYGVTLRDYFHDKDLLPEFRNNIHEYYRDKSLEMQAIVCGFSLVGTPMLFRTDGKTIEECMVPGFVCIGSGEPTARDWLNFRKQNQFISTQRTYYHVREAHAYAKLSIGVSDTCHMLLLRSGFPPVDIGKLTELLNKWTETLYPRKTDNLDDPRAWELFAQVYEVPKPSTPHNSEDKR